jgi:hypothetical protein
MDEFYRQPCAVSAVQSRMTKSNSINWTDIDPDWVLKQCIILMVAGLMEPNIIGIDKFVEARFQQWPS